ncbi:MAG: hypothetical protein GW942_00620 [Candidatus Pacebacteria bacterium]|nr:hypothetical protein [Candidatus Paceibacterota bacterium]
MSAIKYEIGIHHHWKKVVREVRQDRPNEIINRIQERFDRGTITDSQLIEWGKEFESCPHAFVEALLYFGIDID